MASFHELVFKSPQIPTSTGNKQGHVVAKQSDTRRIESLLQHDAQERSIDLNPAVVLDKTQFSEFVHEEIHARTRCSDHLRQGLLGNFRQKVLRRLWFSITGKKQERTC
jgi:hypothetical protein